MARALLRRATMRTTPVPPFGSSSVGGDVLAALTSLLHASDAVFLLLDPSGSRRRVAGRATSPHAADATWAVIDATERHYWQRIRCLPDATYVTADAVPAAWRSIGLQAGHVAVPLRDERQTLRG